MAIVKGGDVCSFTFSGQRAIVGAEEKEGIEWRFPEVSVCLSVRSGTFLIHYS